MSLIPERDFKTCVDRYKGNYRARNFSCIDQFLVMSYAQLTGRDSLRDLENCLTALSRKLYHCGISYAVPRNTLAKANEKRDWHIYKDFLCCKYISIAGQNVHSKIMFPKISGLGMLILGFILSLIGFGIIKSIWASGCTKRRFSLSYNANVCTTISDLLY